jgi:hypothetical protein
LLKAHQVDFFIFFKEKIPRLVYICREEKRKKKKKKKGKFVFQEKKKFEMLAHSRV